MGKTGRVLGGGVAGFAGGPWRVRFTCPRTADWPGTPLTDPWRAGPRFRRTLTGQSRTRSHWAPAHGEPPPHLGWLKLCPELAAPPQLALSSPSLHFSSNYSPSLSPLLSSRPLPVPSSAHSFPPVLNPPPPPLPAPPRPSPSPRSPPPCIMHAVEAPNRIRHLRPSLRRESLCK